MTKNIAKILSFLACAALLIGCMAMVPFTSVSAAVSENLVPNGDFSDGMNHWFDRGPGEVGTGVTDGMLYVGHDGSNNDYTNFVISQPVPVVEGANYTLSFKIKGDEAETIMFAVKTSDNEDGATTGGNDLYDGDWRDITTEWQTVEVDFSATGDILRNFIAVMFVPVKTGFYVDDVKIVQNLPDHGYISNGDFETGDTTGWTVQGWCAADVNVTEEAANGGKYGVHITVGYGNVQRVVAVNPNTTYKVKLDYKGDAVVYFKTADGSNQLHVEWLYDAGGWETAEVSFKTPADMTNLYIEFGATSGNAMIDNISMSEVIPEFSGLVNGDFEGGNLDGWSGTSGTKVTAAAAKDGSYGAHLTGGEGDAQWRGMNQWIDVKKNTTYKFSFDYMCVDTTVYGSLYVKGSTSNDDLLKDVWFQDEVGKWSSDGGVFNTGDFDRIYFQICAGEGEKYIDNIVMVEAGSAQDVTDKLFNDDFELGNDQGWEVDGRNGVTDEDAHTGTYSMKVQGPGEWAKAKQRILVEPNSNYLVTYWVKCMGGSASLFKVADMDNRTVGSTEVWFYGAYDSWKSFSVPFNSGNNTEVYIQFEFAGGAVIYVDDVNVQRYNVQEDVEILSNAGFESGWLEGYGLNGGGEIVEGNAHTGDYSLALNGSINKGRVWKKIKVNPETDYHLTFWANVNGSTASTVSIMDVTNAFSIVDRTLSSTDGWEEVNVVFNSGDNTSIYVSFTYAAGGAIAYIDDIDFKLYDITGKAVLTDMYLDNADKLVAAENLVPLANQSMAIKFNGTEKVVDSILIPVEKDAVYVLTARVKGNPLSAENKGDASFGIADPTNNNNFFIFVKNTMSSANYQFAPPAWDGEWHTISAVFQTGPLDQIALAVKGTSADFELADITICPFDKATYGADSNLTVTNPEPAVMTTTADKDLLTDSEAFWLGGIGYGRHVKFANGALTLKGLDEVPSGMFYLMNIAVEPNTEYIFAYDFLANTNDVMFGLIDSFGVKLNVPVIETATYIPTGFAFNTGASSTITFFVADNGAELSLKNLSLFKASDAASRNGWIKEDGKWAFYENGAKVVNKWVKDSQGWCYLGADGYCVTNTWKKDSVGWCYLNGSGSMVKNAWVHDGSGWYFLDANGYMVSNTWKKDSKGWCYLGSNGKMLTYAWCKDSKGWCYVGADGYCVTNTWKKDSVGWIWLDKNGSMTKNAWIHDGSGWYFLDANGYMVSNTWKKDSKGWCYLGGSGKMLTNAWVKDSKGWCYVGENGYCVTNCWKKDSKGWIYLDENGSMKKNAWIYDKGWYYVDGEGYMVANTSVKWDGKTYYFNATGLCTNP